jgi:predicted regulator of Ras-like GTPase activity (Roadblock/LC7/MglB family)
MATNSTQYRSEQLEKTLRTLHTAVGSIKASVIVNLDGLLVSAYPPSDQMDEEMERSGGMDAVAAMSATLVGLAKRVLTRLQQGDMVRLLMEADEGQMVIYPAGESLLAVLVEKDTRLGKVIYAAGRACDEIRQILGFEDPDNDKKES